MKTRLTALLLALMMLCAWQLPVAVQADQTEPMVLQSEKFRSNLTRYYYDETGNLVRKETNNGKNAAQYTYDAEGTLVQVDHFINNKFFSREDYDPRGNMIAEWREGENGKLNKVTDVTYRFDTYGRVTFMEKKDLITGDKFTEQYEYNKPPQTMFFGEYDQDDQYANGLEPIEWLILDTDGEYTLLLSKFGLDTQSFEKSGKNVTWNDSDLRKWLNVNFLGFAFGLREQMDIRQVQFEKTVGKDYVFLLSPEEVNQYLPAKADRICIPTLSAQDRAQTDPKTGGSWWPLYNADSANTGIGRVKGDGSLEKKGVSTDETGCAIRPALWVRTAAASYAPQTPSRVTYQEYFSEDTLALKDPVSTTTTYDEEGRLTSMENHTTGMTVSMDYDEYGNTIEERTISSFSHLIITAKNTYNEDGLLLQSKTRQEEATLNDKGKKTESYTSTNTITCSYDEEGRLIRQEDQYDDGITLTEEYGYDADGRILWQIQNGSDGSTTTKNWTYGADGSSSCQTVTYSSGKRKTELHEYDPQGNLLRELQDGVLIRENIYVPLSQAQWGN